MTRVLLGIGDQALAGQARVLVDETPGLSVAATAADAGELVAALERSEVDVVIVHEGLGPMPATDFSRELSADFPHIGLVLLVAERRPEVMRAALQAGVRDVIALPLSLTELELGIRSAAEWARAIRQRLEGDANGAGPQGRGTLIAIAGAKGGVGTTTVAIQLALAAARTARSGPTCLADFDLQAGDLRTLLDLPYRRSVADLVAVAGEVSSRNLEETLYVHRSGLRVLLAPDAGEHAEDVDSVAARGILGALRSHHAVTIVDVGSVMTEGGAAAVEMADHVFVVATPDVLSLRAANRLTDLWERLGVRAERTTVVLNRASKDSEVQPDLARKVLASPLAETTLPAGFRDLEGAINTGVPERVNGDLRAGVGRLAEEAGLLPRQAERRTRLSLRSQRGSIAVEMMGMTTTLLVVFLFLWQIVLVGYTYVLAGHAAREGARSLAVGDEVKPSVRSNVPRAWRRDMGIEKLPEDGPNSVKVSLKVPVLVPGLRSPIRVASREGTVIEGGA